MNKKTLFCFILFIFIILIIKNLDIKKKNIKVKQNKSGGNSSNDNDSEKSGNSISILCSCSCCCCLIILYYIVYFALPLLYSQQYTDLLYYCTLNPWNWETFIPLKGLIPFIDNKDISEKVSQCATKALADPELDAIQTGKLIGAAIWCIWMFLCCCCMLCANSFINKDNDDDDDDET